MQCRISAYRVGQKGLFLTFVTTVAAIAANVMTVNVVKREYKVYVSQTVPFFI